jgi:hypothetical protein
MKKLLLCIAITLTTSANALDIKGIKADAPIDCQAMNKAGTPLIQGTDFCNHASTLYMVDAPFLSGIAKMTVSTNADKVVESVHVFNFSYSEATAALTEKFGTPTIMTSVIQNGVGAKFDQEIREWAKGSVTMRLQRHGSKINEPRLTLTGAIFSEKLKRESAKGKGNI